MEIAPIRYDTEALALNDMAYFESIIHTYGYLRVRNFYRHIGIPLNRSNSVQSNTGWRADAIKKVTLKFVDGLWELHLPNTEVI